MPQNQIWIEVDYPPTSTLSYYPVVRLAIPTTSGYLLPMSIRRHGPERRFDGCRMASRLRDPAAVEHPSRFLLRCGNGRRQGGLT
jgi:hypothetical protein